MHYYIFRSTKVTEYRVYYKKEVEQRFQYVSSKVNRVVVSGLTPGTKYEVYVVPYRNGEEWQKTKVLTIQTSTGG